MLISKDFLEKASRLNTPKFLAQGMNNAQSCTPEQKSFVMADGYAVQMNRISNDGNYYLGKLLPKE